MSTSVVPPPPSGGNGKYIAVVVVLGALVGIVLFKSCGGEKPAPVAPVTTVVIAPSAVPVLRIDDIPLPIDVPDAAIETVKHATSTNNNAGCDTKSCSGGTTPELESALGFRAKQAHRCYDTALAQDNTLQGKVSISVRIAQNGNVCNAGVASNDMGSAGVATCVANMFRGSGHFPAPKGGCVDANVPISFVPGGR